MTSTVETYPGRVRLFRDEWPGGLNRGEVLALVTNLARRRCEGDYCLSLQANEVLHEASYAALAALPERGLVDAMRQPDPASAFWRRTRAILEEGLWENVSDPASVPYPRRCIGTTDRVPAIVSHLIGAWSYAIDDSLVALAAATCATDVLAFV